MLRRFPSVLGRVVERVARLSPPRHRELVRGMVAELDSIADPAERTRCAVGAAVGRAGVSAGGIIEALLVAVPHTVALTIPMAVFLAVSWAFMRLGKEGVLASARRERHGVRRLVAPVLGAAAVIAALTFVSNAEVVPRANARLAAVRRHVDGERGSSRHRSTSPVATWQPWRDKWS